MFNNTGQMRIIEVFLSIILFFSALTVATTLSPGSNLEIDQTLQQVGMNSLLSIDHEGELGRLIDEEDWDSITDALKILLPASVTYNLSVYDRQMLLVNNVSISNGLLSNQDVISVQYPCASSNAKATLYLLRLRLAKVE